MSETLKSLIERSLEEKPIGEGAFHKVYTIGDDRFNNYLIRVEHDFNGYVNEFETVPNIYQGRNFGQAIIKQPKQQKQKEIEVIAYAGTCLNREYIIQREILSGQLQCSEEAKKQAYYMQLQKLSAMPQESYDSIIDRAKFLNSIDKLIDTFKPNFAYNKAYVNFIDIDDSRYGYDSLTVYDISKTFAKIDRGNYKGKFLDPEFSQHIKTMEEKLIQANKGKVNVSHGPVEYYMLQLTMPKPVCMKASIKADEPTDKLQEILSHAENTYGLQTIARER